MITKDQKTKSKAGQLFYLAGCSAEAQVAADYARRGYQLWHQRWRGQGGEIDLVFRASTHSEIVFVEVKKSRSFAHAARRISEHQQRRICAAAEEFLGTLERGLLTPMRIDAAFVNGRGEIEVLENAIEAM